MVGRQDPIPCEGDRARDHERVGQAQAATVLGTEARRGARDRSVRRLNRRWKRSEEVVHGNGSSLISAERTDQDRRV